MDELRNRKGYINLRVWGLFGVKKSSSFLVFCHFVINFVAEMEIKKFHAYGTMEQMVFDLCIERVERNYSFGGGR